MTLTAGRRDRGNCSGVVWLNGLPHVQLYARSRLRLVLHGKLRLLHGDADEPAAARLSGVPADGRGHRPRLDRGHPGATDAVDRATRGRHRRSLREAEAVDYNAAVHRRRECGTRDADHHGPHRVLASPGRHPRPRRHDLDHDAGEAGDAAEPGPATPRDERHLAADGEYESHAHRRSDHRRVAHRAARHWCRVGAGRGDIPRLRGDAPEVAEVRHGHGGRGPELPRGSGRRVPLRRQPTPAAVADS